MASIAFLGTGALGSGFVKAACERGWDVVIWNRTREKAEALSLRDHLPPRGPQRRNGPRGAGLGGDGFPRRGPDPGSVAGHSLQPSPHRLRLGARDRRLRPQRQGGGRGGRRHAGLRLHGCEAPAPGTGSQATRMTSPSPEAGGERGPDPTCGSGSSPCPRPSCGSTRSPGRRPFPAPDRIPSEADPPLRP